MKRSIVLLFLALAVLLLLHEGSAAQKIPVVVITDLYHPYQDPGDNLDLINAFRFPNVDLKAVVLDISYPFRKDTADHPTLWKDPRGPREAGFIPVLQLNYIFDHDVPYALGPMSMMKSETDKMTDIPDFQQKGVKLLLDVLRKSTKPVEVLSFGSARILAVAYNREPALMKSKIAKIHLCAGTAASNFQLGSDKGANAIPGGEWNVALDPYAFTRILRSDLPVALYPCSGVNGAFIKDRNSTYWRQPNLEFVGKMDIRLQRYIDFAMMQSETGTFLLSMDRGDPFLRNFPSYPAPFHVWETPVWIIASHCLLVRNTNGAYEIIPKSGSKPGDLVISNELRACTILVRDDGRFTFEYTSKPTNFSIFYNDDPEFHEKALQQAAPKLFISYSTKK
jgi:pyrimidine-specific ribonucleoside hydrolase